MIFKAKIDIENSKWPPKFKMAAKNEKYSFFHNYFLFWCHLILNMLQKWLLTFKINVLTEFISFISKNETKYRFTYSISPGVFLDPNSKLAVSHPFYHENISEMSHFTRKRCINKVTKASNWNSNSFKNIH